MSDEHQRPSPTSSFLATDEDALAEIRAELLDCYGFIPERDNLLEVIPDRNALTDLKGRKMKGTTRSSFVHFSRTVPSIRPDQRPREI